MTLLKLSQCILVYHSLTLRTENTNGQHFHLVQKSWQKVSVRFLSWLSISVQKRGITFIRQGLSKSDRQNHVNNKIFVPSFSQDSLLDPVRVLKVYLKRTKKFREFGQDQAKFSLFLSVVEPHKSVTSQTI